MSKVSKPEEVILTHKDAQKEGSFSWKQELKTGMPENASEWEKMSQHRISLGAEQQHALRLK